MQRYGGTLIHSSRDHEGVIEVVDAHGVRSLHFGTPPKQSSMSLTEPDRLELPYVRAMTGALMFHDHPARVLILGLGGGSLARFFLSEFPECEVTAVELRRQVVEVARQFFHLPEDGRLSLHVADADAYVYSERESVASRYDLLLVDTYDHIGMVPHINAASFFANAKSLLSPQGVLAINLWGTHKVSLQRATDLLKKTFGPKCFKLPVPNRGNVIGFGLNSDANITVIKSLSAKAMELEVRLGVEMRQFLERVKAF